MTDQQHIPEDDKDLQLARKIGNSLESGSPLSERDDPLLSLLLDYKRRVGTESHRYTPDSSDLWSRIEAKTKPDTGRDSGATVHRLRTADRRRLWAVAASILIIVLAGYFYFMEPSRPTLIAETQQAQMTVALDDGSRVTLRPYSKIYLVGQAGDEILYELSGEGYFDVAAGQDRIFSVTAGNGRVSVLGTRFVLSNWGDMVQVFLEEGSVRLETVDRTQSTLLEPGQFAAITGERQIRTPKNADISQFTDWMNDELSFRNREAEYVFYELEQHFNIEIEAPNTVSDMKIGGTLSLARLDSSLIDLGTVLGGSFESTGDRAYNFIPRE